MAASFRYPDLCKLKAKIEAAVATYAPHLIGSTEEVKQVASQEALDALVMPPKAERTPKLSKVQRAIAAEIGLFIYFMEYFVANSRSSGLCTRYRQ